MNISDSRLYHKVTISSRKECDFGSMQQVVKNGTFCSNYEGNNGRRISKTIQKQHVKIIQVTGECNKQQGTTVCSRVNEGVQQDVGNRDKIIDGIPFTNRWADRTDKLSVRIILEVLYRV